MNLLSSSFATSNARLITIADAQHMLANLDGYWPALEKFGATPADKKLLIERIARAIALNDAEEAPADNELSELRPELNHRRRISRLGVAHRVWAA